MKYFKTYAALFLVSSLISISCSNKIKAEINGGSCSYVSFEGTAIIRLITPAPATEYNCPDGPVQIIFEFVPDELSDRTKYRFSDFTDTEVRMTINDGANPSMNWVKNNGIEKGKKFRCFRTELVKGTCTPVIFTFPELNLFPETGCE